RSFWVHAARTPGQGWRSNLASLAAIGRAYDFEVRRLRQSSGNASSIAAAPLAAYLEARMTDAWERHHWTAAVALTEKAAQLYHLAAARERDRGKRESLVAKAAALYGQADDRAALKSVSGP